MPLPYLCNIKSNKMYNLKNKIIMKALVLSVVFALTSGVNAVSGNNAVSYTHLVHFRTSVRMKTNSKDKKIFETQFSAPNKYSN